ncbi:MAG: M28 family peptidase [Bacteroidales bacterium]|nr:M28 family peptidase [Bacteroidales bacterium]
MKRFLACLLFGMCLTALAPAFGQDSLYYRELIEKLTSEEFKGRGYSFGGDRIAAQFIAEEMRKYNLQSWTPDYMQLVPIDMNLFEGEAHVHFDTQDSNLVLFDNVEFMPYSCGVKGSFAVRSISPKALEKTAQNPGTIYQNCFVCVDISGLNPKDSAQNALLKTANKIFFDNPLKAKGYIVVSEQLMGWHIGHGQYPKEHTTINVLKRCLNRTPKKVVISLDQRFQPQYPSQNVCGFIEGKTHPDSFFVFTGHYDHLGKFGNNYTFYGANDNASGAAFVLDLARHYSQPENRPDYSMVFMCFTGEEVGLIGSSYNCEHPFFPLENIKMLFNLDMVGTNEDGITVVCATSFPEEFEHLKRINEEHQYLAKVNSRKPAANSDHYPYFKKGCKTFFIYGMGKSGRYHSQYDVLDALSIGNYSGLFHLLTDYISSYNTPVATPVFVPLR